ncbi:MAG: hypothetical protein CMJ26_03370 [Phycisphaerae bacterium]|nr:hypothetical protein [Phycisphaerae bacterium]
MNNFERHGEHTGMFISLGATELSARQHGSHTHNKESNVNISIDANKFHCFAPGENGKRL